MDSAAQETQLLPGEAVTPGSASERWRMFAVSTAGFCVFLSVYAPQSLLPLLRQIFHSTEARTSWVITATTLAVAISAPLMGLFAQRVGRKKVIVGSIFALAVPTYLTCFAKTLPQLILWRFAQGLLMPGIIAVTMAYVCEHWPANRVGKAMGAYVTGNVLGGVTGRLISGWLGSHYSWQSSFELLTVVDIVGGFVVWLGLPGGAAVRPDETDEDLFTQFVAHFHNRPLLMTYAAGFFMLLTLVAIFTYITYHLAEEPFHLGPAALGLLFLVYLFGVLVTPIAGTYIDRIGPRSSILLASVVVAVGVALTLAPSLVMIIIGLALTSSGIFVCQAANAGYMGLVAGRDKASASGLYASFYYLGGAGGAFIPGLFWHVGHWPATVLFLFGVIAATAAIASTYRPPVARM